MTDFPGGLVAPLNHVLFTVGQDHVTAAELRRADADPDAVPPNVASTLIRADTGSNLIAVPCDLVAARLFEGWDEAGELVAVVWTMVE